ncbi:hypothetical protein EVA_18790, partial [gut metagenome]
ATDAHAERTGGGEVSAGHPGESNEIQPAGMAV